MGRKYDRVDKQLLEWLRGNPAEATTAAAIEALGITSPTIQRHISRRFSLLEDRGALVCDLKGTTRVCSVDPARLPPVLHKQGGSAAWRTLMRTEVAVLQPAGPAPRSSTPSIPASTSDEFLAAGGVIERLPSHWDTLGPSKTLGPMTLLDHLSDLD